eukprot:s1135_g10.t1
MAAATWSVMAITMAGESFEISDLSDEDTLPSLTCKVEAALGLEVDAQRRVTLLHEHCPLAGTKRLAELGVQPGTELLCVMRRAAFEVREGMKVHVTAGTASVVGSYIARPNKSGTMTFHHTSRENQRIAWYPKQETTTAGTLRAVLSDRPAVSTSSLPTATAAFRWKVGRSTLLELFATLASLPCRKSRWWKLTEECQPEDIKNSMHLAACTVVQCLSHGDICSNGV